MTLFICLFLIIFLSFKRDFGNKLLFFSTPFLRSFRAIQQLFGLLDGLELGMLSQRVQVGEPQISN